MRDRYYIGEAIVRENEGVGISENLLSLGFADETGVLTQPTCRSLSQPGPAAIAFLTQPLRDRPSDRLRYDRLIPKATPMSTVWEWSGAIDDG